MLLPTTASSDRRGVADPRGRWARLSALACLLGLIATWLVADLVPAVRVRDASALHGFIGLGRPWIDFVANHTLSLVGVVPSALFGAMLIGLAVARGRPRTALAVPVVLIGSVLMSEALKPLLAHSHVTLGGSVHVSDASWPSGHSTEAMAMALCAVLAAPRRWRATAAVLGAVFTIAVAFSLLTLAWHMPSDVVGGFLVAGLWMSGAVTALLSAQARWPERSGRDALNRAGRALRGGPRRQSRMPRAGEIAWSAVAAATLAFAVAVALLRRDQVVTFADAHQSLVAAAAAIAALATALVTGLLVALRS